MTTPQEVHKHQRIDDLTQRWGDDPAAWVPPASGLPVQSPHTWPRGLIHALHHVSLRTHTFADRDVVVSRIATQMHRRINQVAGSGAASSQLIAADVDAAYNYLAQTMDAVDKLYDAIDEDPLGWLPANALPSPSALDWDIRFTLRLAEFISTHDNEAGTIEIIVFPMTIASRLALNPNSSHCVTIADLASADNMYDKVMRDMEAKSLKESREEEAKKAEKQRKAGEEEEKKKEEAAAAAAAAKKKKKQQKAAKRKREEEEAARKAEDEEAPDGFVPKETYLELKEDHKKLEEDYERLKKMYDEVDDDLDVTERRRDKYKEENMKLKQELEKCKNA